MAKLNYLLALGAVLIGVCAYADPHSSTFLNPLVCKVVDGDTFKLCDGMSIRLAGIDTPEHGEPFYWEARKALAGWIQTHDLKLTGCHTDTTGKRQACSVQADGKDVEAELVRQGLAWDWLRVAMLNKRLLLKNLKQTCGLMRKLPLSIGKTETKELNSLLASLVWYLLGGKVENGHQLYYRRFVYRNYFRF